METRSFDVPMDLAEFLDKWAPKAGRDDAQQLVVSILEEYRSKRQPRLKPGIDPQAPWYRNWLKSR